MNVYKNDFSYFLTLKTNYNLKKKMGYEITYLQFIIINPKLKYFEIIITFSLNDR